MVGVLIAFEGIDGSGLTTHSRLLVGKLRARGVPAAYTKEPTEGPIGRVIRSILSGGRGDSHDILALLFAADRLYHYRQDPTLPGGEGIQGALERGYTVVTDRYKYSSLAYQGAFLGVEWVDSLNVRVPEAHIVVFIDVPPEVALRRIGERDSRELYETRVRLEKVYRTFETVLRLAESRGVRVIRVRPVVDGVERSIEEVNAEICSRLEEELSTLRRL